MLMDKYPCDWRVLETFGADVRTKELENSVSLSLKHYLVPTYVHNIQYMPLCALINNDILR